MTIDIFKVPQGEMNILRILWDAVKPMTTEQLSSSLLERFGKRVKHATVHTLASRLVKKGLILYVQVSGRNLYMPLCPETEYQAFVVKGFLHALYHGSVVEMVCSLLRNGSIGREELAALKDLADTALMLGDSAGEGESEEGMETTETAAEAAEKPEEAEEAFGAEAAILEIRKAAIPCPTVKPIKSSGKRRKRGQYFFKTRDRPTAM